MGQEKRKGPTGSRAQCNVSADAPTFSKVHRRVQALGASLADEHWLLELPTDDELAKLIALGIDEEALWSPWPLRVANVIFRDHLFDFADEGGQRAFILRCDDCGFASDLVAWRGDRLATFHGVGFAVGDRDAIHNPATYFANGKLRNHRTVPDWLRANRDGILILRPNWAYGELKSVPAIAVADEAQRLELVRMLEPPKLKARIVLDIAPGVKVDAGAQ
jgi:hypothetical protein